MVNAITYQPPPTVIIENQIGNMYVDDNFKKQYVEWITRERSGNGYYNVMCNCSRSEYHKAIKYINKNKVLINRVTWRHIYVKLCML